MTGSGCRPARTGNRVGRLVAPPDRDQPLFRRAVVARLRGALDRDPFRLPASVLVSIPNSASIRAYRFCSACTARAIAGSTYMVTDASATPTACALSRRRRFAASSSATVWCVTARFAFVSCKSRLLHETNAVRAQR